MAADSTAIFVPGHGTVFVADPSATFPATPLTAFTLTGTPPAGWTSIGHTSKDNTAAFNKDGGDATTLDTWLADAVRTIYAANAWSLGINPLQLDQTGLGLAFNGTIDTDGGYIVPGSNNGLTKQIYLLATDGTASLGFWMPNTSILLGDAPSIDPTKFFELPLSASINAADVSKIPAVGGVPGIMKVYKTGLTPSAPVLSSVSPNTGATGIPVQINGSGFTGVTGASGVQFGTTNVGAGNYVVVSDSVIIAIVPAATAGSQPVKVTNGTGPSNTLAFTHS